MRYYISMYAPNNNKFQVSIDEENKEKAIEKALEQYPIDKGYTGHYINK